MNTKHYLTIILIFATILLSGFSAKSQNNSDTIKIEKRGLGYVYYKGNVMLNFSQVKQETFSIPEAYLLMVKSSNMRMASYIFGFVGGLSLGTSLGHALGYVLTGNFNNRLFYSTLVVGVGLIGIGIVFDLTSYNKFKEGVAIYNNAIKQKNNANLGLGFSTNGMMLRLNF